MKANRLTLRIAIYLFISLLAPNIMHADNSLISSVIVDRTNSSNDEVLFQVSFFDALTSNPQNFPDFYIVALPTSHDFADSSHIICGTDTSDPSIELDTEISWEIDSNDSSVLTISMTGMSQEGYYGICPTNNENAFEDISAPVSEFYKLNYPAYVTNVTSSNLDGTYIKDDTILITIKFSEPVWFSEDFNPSLELELNNPETFAYLAVPFDVETITDTLEFEYTVIDGDTTDDLQYESTASFVLLDGYSVDTFGTELDVYQALPSVNPVAPNSLAGNKDIIVDTIMEPQEAGEPLEVNAISEDKDSVKQGKSGGGVVSINTINTSSSDNSPLPEEAESAVTDSSCPHFITYHDVGERKDEIQKIQGFLNTYENATLTVDGLYGMDTFQAVKAFQSKYASAILEPWGLGPDEATGFWYKSTVRFANYLLGCDTPAIEVEDGIIIDEYPSDIKKYIESNTK